MEINYKTIGGILLALIVTASGTYYLAKTGEYKSCQGLWELQESGQYKCSRNDVLAWCYSTEYRGGGWNRCWNGKPIIVEVPVNQSVPDNTTLLTGKYISCQGRVWLVDPIAEVITDETKLFNTNLEKRMGECR